MTSDMSFPYQKPLGSSQRAQGNMTSAHIRPVRFGLSTGGLKTSYTNFKLASSARTLGLTEKVVETFLWSFLALDVMGMWVPRIKVSLTRGAIPYDVRQDPTMQGKPLHVQVRKSIIENSKGLNWTNLYEEACREFATGPGMLMLPTMVYLLAGRVAGGHSLRMSSPVLTSHGIAFSDYLKNISTDNILNQKHSTQSKEALLNAYRDQVKNYLVHVLKDDDFFKFDPRQALTAYRQALPHHEREHLEKLLPLDRCQTGEQYLKEWMTHWTQHNIQNDFINHKVTQAGFEKMGPAYQEIQNLLVDKFNEDHQLAKASAQHAKVNLMQLGEVRILGKFSSLNEFLGNKSFQGDLEKLSHYFSYIARERVKGKPGLISDIAKGVMQKAGARKSIQLLAAIASGIYVAALVRITQKHDTYPGERLAHMERTAGKNEKHIKTHEQREHEQLAQQMLRPGAINLTNTSWLNRMPAMSNLSSVSGNIDSTISNSPTNQINPVLLIPQQTKVSPDISSPASTSANLAHFNNQNAGQISPFVLSSRGGQS